MADIEVARVETGEPAMFRVRVVDDRGSAEFRVTLSSEDRRRLATGYPSAEAFIRACFAFLLEREPKESILRSFDVSVISTYFPEFEATISRSTR
jgi:hypothetical protein